MKARAALAFALAVAAAAWGAPAAGFDGSIILGRPTDREITARVVPATPAEVLIEYGAAPGAYTRRTARVAASRERPATLVMEGLAPAARAWYRLQYTQGGRTGWTEEHSASTARAPGETFTFVLQSDSHLLNKADKAVYAAAMEQMAGLGPDLFFDLGDTFLNDKDPKTPFAEINDITYEQVPYLGRVACGAPLFLVVGNHEGEYGYLLDGTADNMSVYAALSRKQLFPNPVPNAFYSGNDSEEPFVGRPENYYAFAWGDALFVALDPYRYTLKDPAGTRDPWDWTLGERQYKWLERTLRASRARYKFVFAHHALGNTRGGAGIAGLYEWGGADPRGRDLFAQKRPGWAMPVQQLFKETGVTIFFQGHDHIFARETVDGVVYQTLPKPAEVVPDQQSNLESYEGADVQINSGFLAVRVAPERIQVDYHRTVVAGQPGNPGTGVVHSYTVDSARRVSVLKRTDDSAAFAAYGGTGEKQPRRESRDDRKKAAEPQAGSSSPSSRQGRQGGQARESRQGSETAQRGPTPQTGARPQPAGSLHAQPFLGRPGQTDVTISTVFDEPVRYYYRYGSDPKALDRRTAEKSADAGTAAVDTLRDLPAGQRSYYSLVLTGSGAGAPVESEVRGFATRKPAGAELTFLVEADPHLDEATGSSRYQETLRAMAGEGADFVVDLGDASMVEKLASSEGEVRERNRLLRSYWDDLAGSTPLFMVLGNHDGEAGWRSPQNKPATSVAAAVRRSLFPNPAPPQDAIYSGLSDSVYSWEWGDALFVVLDPYAYTTTKPRDDNWGWTLGRQQYDWLAGVLERSTARYRFVFIHNLVGGLGPDGRGGAEAARLYEWGGRGADGRTLFGEKRPGWPMPIHELLVKHGVDVVFHGHDHFYARQELDGVVYQMVPQPGLGGRQKVEELAAEYGYKSGVFLPSPGYLRVRVAPDAASVELLSDGKVVHSYRIAP